MGTIKIERVTNKNLRRTVIVDDCVRGVSWTGTNNQYKVSVSVGELGKFADSPAHYNLEMSPEAAIELGKLIQESGKKAIDRSRMPDRVVGLLGANLEMSASDIHKALDLAAWEFQEVVLTLEELKKAGKVTRLKTGKWTDIVHLNKGL